MYRLLWLEKEIIAPRRKCSFLPNLTRFGGFVIGSRTLEQMQECLNSYHMDIAKSKNYGFEGNIKSWVK
jgi:hypothetical protein